MSRHNFTQNRLMVWLVLKSYLKTSYRKMVDFLQGHGGLRRVLGLEAKLPHYASLQKFSARSEVLAIGETPIVAIGEATLRQQEPEAAVAISSARVDVSGASAIF